MSIAVPSVKIRDPENEYEVSVPDDGLIEIKHIQSGHSIVMDPNILIGMVQQVVVADENMAQLIEKIKNGRSND